MKRPALIALLVGMLCCATRGFAAEPSIADLIASLKAADNASDRGPRGAQAKGPDAANRAALIDILKSAHATSALHGAEALRRSGLPPSPRPRNWPVWRAGRRCRHREAIEALASIRPGPKVMLPIWRAPTRI